jgi:hypothetical protein
MATRKVTVSLEVGALELAERAARRDGLSISAWLSRAARREAVRTGVGRPTPDEQALAEAINDEAERAAAEAELRAAS